MKPDNKFRKIDLGTLHGFLFYINDHKVDHHFSIALTIANSIFDERITDCYE
jgi:hypothetical protein